MNHKTYFTLIFLFVVSSSFSQSSVYIGDSGKAKLEQYDLEGNFISLLDDDINTPRGITSDGDLLFAVNKDRGELIRYDLDFNVKTVIIDGLGDAVDVTAINGEDFLIITERDGEISRVDYDGSNYTSLTREIPDPLLLSHDPIAKKVFITNTATIYSMNYDGTDVISIPGLYDEVVSIELDPRNSTIYFAERGNTQQLSKMNYDGSQREVILSTSLLFSYIDLHCEQNKIYFTAGSNNLFGSFDLDGSNLDTIAITPVVIGGLDLVPNDCDMLSSVEEKNISEVKVFPNPSNGFVYIEHYSNLEKIELLDFQGRVVQTLKANPQSFSIQLDLDQGSYLLRIFSDSGISYKKVIRL